MMNAEPVRVLYMEDDGGAARLFQKKLQRLGYEIDLACNGEEGLQMYNAGSYDLIAVDQRMPVYDGIEVIRYLAERGPLPPTIMITGAGDEKVAVEAMKLGAGDYIVKDIDGGYLELLPAVMEQLLQRQRLIRERQQALEALEGRNRNLALLNRVGQALTEMLNREQVLEQTLQTANDIIGAEASSIWLRNDGQEGTWLTAALCNGNYCAHGNACVQDGQGLVGWVVQNDDNAITSDERLDPNRYPELAAYPDISVTMLLVVPLRVRDTVIGALQVANKKDGSFNDDDQVLLETLAASAAIAVDNARLVDALRQHATDLQSRNEELDAFSHMVAHDLKNPLSLTIGYAQFLKKRHAGSFDEDTYKCVDQIEHSGIKMSNIIDELLRLAKIRSTEVQPEPLDMEDIVAMAELRVTNMIEEYGAQVTWPDSWPTVLGQDAWIEEVWVNYLSNALKYGGRPPRIELGWTPQDEGMVRFWVRDNGQGLTPEEQAKLFTPFTRLSQVRVEGHGLGLSIVRRIVEKLGGAVSVESNVGEGSVFGFTLPVANG
jgi:signal transduction histidine kinase/DNA-binding response OmpR family regulator